MPTFSLGLLPQSRGFCRLSPSRHYSPHHILLAIKLLKKTLCEYKTKNSISVWSIQIHTQPKSNPTFPQSSQQISPNNKWWQDKISTFCSAQAAVNVVNLAWLLGEVDAFASDQPPIELSTAIQGDGKSKKQRGKGGCLFLLNILIWSPETQRWKKHIWKTSCKTPRGNYSKISINNINFHSFITAPKNPVSSSQSSKNQFSYELMIIQ